MPYLRGCTTARASAESSPCVFWPPRIVPTRELHRDRLQIWEVGGVPMITLVLAHAIVLRLIVREGLFLSGHPLSASNFCTRRMRRCATIGLLGTVMGLVQVFVIDTSPDGIAGGISQAPSPPRLYSYRCSNAHCSAIILRWRNYASPSRPDIARLSHEHTQTLTIWAG